MVGILSALVGPIAGILDEFHHSPEEKADAAVKLERVLQEKGFDIEETIRLELSSRSDIIKAEMAQGDAYTKRARPTLVYWGMALITLREAVVWAVTLTEKTIEVPSLPAEFWWAWGTVVSVWSAGRSMEKRGAVSEKLSGIVGAVTGRSS